MEASATIRAVVTRARSMKLTFFAASIAYYAFFSIIPLLLLALAVGSAIGGQVFANRIVELVGNLLSAEGRTVVEEALTSPAGRGGASVVGVTGLLWGALKLFRALDLAFDQVCEGGEETSLIRQLVNGTAALALISLSMVVMIGLGTISRSTDLIDVPGVSLLG